MTQDAKNISAMGAIKRPVTLCAALAMLGFLAACSGAPAPLAQDDASRRASIAPKSQPVRIMAIDKTAYPTPPPRPAKVRILGLLLPLGDRREAIRSLAGH